MIVSIICSVSFHRKKEKEKLGLQFLPPVTESMQKYHYFKIAWENKSAGPLNRHTLKTVLFKLTLGSQIPIVSTGQDFYNLKMKG